MSFENDEQFAAQAVQARAYDEAVRLLRPLAERNSEYALLTLGWIYETGVTGPPDVPAARSLYEQAVAQGSANGCLYLGWLLLSCGDEAEARAEFERGAQRSDEECKSELRRLNDHADEKEAARLLEAEDFVGAAQLLRPLADRDSEYALRCLGWLYETGHTGAPDMDAARSCYLRAAALGSGPAQYDLGRFLQAQGAETGARAAFQAGATLGDLPSMSQLGKMMIRGRGGPNDVAYGWAWLEKAADAGHIWARRELLAIEEDNAPSVFRKLAVKVKILRLALSGAREATRDPQSDKVR